MISYEIRIKYKVDKDKQWANISSIVTNKASLELLTQIYTDRVKIDNHILAIKINEVGKTQATIITKKSEV